MPKQAGDTFGEGTGKRTLVDDGKGGVKPSYTPDRPDKGCLVILVGMILPSLLALYALIA